MRLLDKLFLTATNDTLVQLFRYTLVGGGAFAVDFFLLWYLTEVGGFNYLLSATLSFMAGLAVNYLIATHWVFRKDVAVLRNKWAEFLVFLLIGLVGLGLNDLILWSVTRHLR
ncbi:MAG: GtrA family protein, partial [Odoribacter sp.]|nr:GtrA family protein [Odoribacter sp.]